jgi:membrane protein required for beta-lactamase induction
MTLPNQPWYRHPIMWLVVGGPAVVVVAGFATLAIALAHPDPVLQTTATPAVQARNHAATPPRAP